MPHVSPSKSKAYKAAYYRSRREHFLHVERVRQYRVKYGITLDRYEEMLREQDGRCAICATEEAGARIKFFCVDHNHKTGEVRGLLCQKCNSILGWYEKYSNDVHRYLTKRRGALKAL